MNADLFLDELADLFGKRPHPKQALIYREKLRRFSPEQLLEILNKVIEEAKGFPRVSDIFKAATELGYLAIDNVSTHHHRWKPSACKLCAGEGRLCVTWIFGVETEHDRRDYYALKQIVPYSQSLQLRLEAREFRSLWRCYCLAGEAVTLPKNWPRWQKSMNPVRYL